MQRVYTACKITEYFLRYKELLSVIKFYIRIRSIEVIRIFMALPCGRRQKFIRFKGDILQTTSPNGALTMRLNLKTAPTAFLCRNKTTATQNRNHIITVFYLKTPPTAFGVNTKNARQAMAGAYIPHNRSYSAFVSPGSCPAVLSSATLNSVKPAPTRILNHDSAFFISDTCTRSRS